MGSRKVFCMLSFLLAATCVFAADYAVPKVSLDAEKEIPIWPGNVPGPKINGTEQCNNNSDNLVVWNVSVPRMEMFVPKGQNRTTTAVIICPGGGYSGLAVDMEGYQVAKWLNSLGVTAFVLKCRLKEYGHPWPICDLQQAIRVVRQRADKFGIAKDKIGVAGFSAGGHLASTASVHWRHDFLKDAPAIDNLRPDFSILGYPVISFQPGITHQNSKTNLLGNKPTKIIVDMLSNELHIDSETPPAFLVHASGDIHVPVENSIRYYQGLIKAGVNAELHVFGKGGHGFGLATDNETLSIWPKLCENWLRDNGLLKVEKQP